MCGSTRPTKPIEPDEETTTAVMRAAHPSNTTRVRCTETPSETASFSPNMNASMELAIPMVSTRKHPAGRVRPAGCAAGLHDDASQAQPRTRAELPSSKADSSANEQTDFFTCIWVIPLGCGMLWGDGSH